MKIRPYMRQLFRWIVLLQVSLVALVPIGKDDIGGSIASNNSANEEDIVDEPKPDDKELSQSEVRFKRQVDDPDDEFKPKPSDLTEDDVNLESQAFFYPVANNSDESESSVSNLLKKCLDKVKKPKDDNIQVPLYDYDVEGNIDPLQGVLDPKYWEKRSDPSSKITDFFANASEMDGKAINLNNEENLDKHKDFSKAEIEDSDKQFRSEEESCRGGLLNLPTRYIQKAKSPDTYNKNKKDEGRRHQAKQFGGRKKSGKSWKSITDEDRPAVSDSDAVDDENGNQVQCVVKATQIRSDLVTNLGNVLDTLVKGVVNGALDSGNKSVKYKDVEDVALADNVSLSKDIYDNNAFGVKPGRQLLSLVDDDQNLESSASRDSELGNYFAVNANIDNSRREKQTNLDFLKNALLGVRKSNDEIQTRLSNDIINGLVQNLSEIRNSKRSAVPSMTRLRKGRRRQIIAQPDYLQPANGKDQSAAKELEKLPTTSPTTVGLPSATTSISNASHITISVTSPNSTIKQPNVVEDTSTSNFSIPEDMVEPTANATVDDDDEQLSIDISNKVVDAIFEQAEAHPGLRNSLGICRKSGDLQTIKGSKVAANKSDSIIEDIMKCVGTMLKAHEEKTQCLTLDDSLKEFLKWLLLTGEAMHGKGFIAPRPDRDRSEFLFPSVCDQPTPSDQNNKSKEKSKQRKYF